MALSLNSGINFHYDNVFINMPVKYSGITLYQVGEMSCEGEFLCATHKQWCHEITYIISGNGIFSLDNQNFNVQEEDIFISPLDRMHQVYIGRNETLRYAYIAFDFNEDATDADYALLKNFFRPNMPQICAKDHVGLLYTFFRGLDEYYHKYSGYRMMFDCYIKQILILTYRSFLDEKAWNPKTTAGSDHPIGSTIYSVVRYIEDNICDIYHIKDITDTLGYTHSYISKLFKQKMNMTMQQFLMNKRIEKAQELLCRNEFSITQIATKLNFSNVQCFSRAFSRAKKMSPSQFAAFRNNEKKISDS